MNRRLRAGDKAGEDQGVTREYKGDGFHSRTSERT